METTLPLVRRVEWGRGSLGGHDHSFLKVTPAFVTRLDSYCGIEATRSELQWIVLAANRNLDGRVARRLVVFSTAFQRRRVSQSERSDAMYHGRWYMFQLSLNIPLEFRRSQNTCEKSNTHYRCFNPSLIFHLLAQYLTVTELQVLLYKPKDNYFGYLSSYVTWII